MTPRLVRHRDSDSFYVFRLFIDLHIHDMARITVNWKKKKKKKIQNVLANFPWHSPEESARTYELCNFHLLAGRWPSTVSTLQHIENFTSQNVDLIENKVVPTKSTTRHHLFIYAIKYLWILKDAKKMSHRVICDHASVSQFRLSLK